LVSEKMSEMTSKFGSQGSTERMLLLWSWLTGGQPRVSEFELIFLTFSQQPNSSDLS